MFPCSCTSLSISDCATPADLLLARLNRLQPLFAASSLFAKIEDPSQAQSNHGGKGNRKRKWKAERVKIGQGGTLDPLADGVLGKFHSCNQISTAVSRPHSFISSLLVIGTNSATKQLSKFLDCTKVRPIWPFARRLNSNQVSQEYRAIGLFGCATDTYDSEGKRVTECGWEGVTKEKIEGVLSRFRGEIEQVPPMYVQFLPR